MRTSVKYLLFLFFIIFVLLVVVTTPGVNAKRALADNDDDDDDDDDDDRAAKDNGQPAAEKPVELKVVPTKPKQLDQFKDFAQEVLKDTLNKICQDPDQAIVVFGVALSQCTINWNDGTIQVKGLARILDKLDVNVDLEVSSDPETKKKDYAVRLQLPSSFKISDAVVALKMTAIDKLTIRNPAITIVSSTKNSWGASPGVTIYVEIAPGKDDNFGKFFTPDTYFSAEVAISTANDISELGKAGNKDYTLTLTANNFNVGTPKVLCEKALVAISTGSPQFKADVDCKVKLSSGDLTTKIEVETKKPVAGDVTSKRSFQIAGSVLGPINNVFGVDGMTLQKAGVAASFEGGLKSFTFNGEVSFKGTNFALEGDVVEGEYSFTVSNTNLKDILVLLGQDSLKDKVPSFTLEEVKVTIQTATPTAGAKFKVSAKVQGQVSDFDIHASAILELSKGKVSLTASLEKSFDVGPVTLRDPSISVVAQSSDASYSFFLSGVTKVFDLDNLKTTVGFAKVAGQNGFLINVQLGQTFSLGQIIKPLKGTVMDGLAFKDPEVQISSYPVAYIDNVKRTGVVLKANLIFQGTKQLEGVKALIGGKAAELPLVLPFGGSLTGFDIRQIKIIAVIPFPVKTGTKVIEFLDPMSLAIGFQPPSFGLNLDLIVRFPMDNQPLQFRVSFTLDVVGATAVTETMNEWVAPFGLKGLVVRKLALDVGINYVQFAATGTPSRIGIAGYFEFPVVGKVEIATLADIVKNQYILYAYIERFGLQSLREILAQLGVNVPKQLLPDIDFRQIKLYVAPTGGNIGSITFEPGYNFEGQLWVFNKNFAEIKVIVNFAQGIIAYGRVSAAKIGPLDLSESYIDLAVTPSKQHFYVNAKITIKIVFEIVRQELQIRIDSKQLYFKYDNKIYTIEASANPRNPTDLTITGTIKFDVINDIIKGMTMAIRQVGKGLDELAKVLEKLEKQKKNIEKGIKSIPIPSNCGSVATLAYDNDDMTPVQDFSKFLAEMDSHLGLSEFRQMLEEEEAEAAALDADDIAEEALLEYEEESLEMYSEDQAMTQGFWRRLRSAFRRAGRAISRAARSAGNAIKRTASKAGNAIKRTAVKAGHGIKRTAVKAGNGIKRTAITAGNGIKHGAIITGKHIKKGAIIAGTNIKKGAIIVGKELKKICDKAINEVRKAKNKLAEVAAEATTVAAKYTKEASKYTSGFLKNGFFELQSISFTASLAKVQQTGGLSVDVKIKVAGQQKTIGFNLKAMSKVKDLAKDIVNKIIKK